MDIYIALGRTPEVLHVLLSRSFFFERYFAASGDWPGEYKVPYLHRVFSGSVRKFQGPALL